MPAPPQWLEWSRKLQAIAQNGLLFTQNGFDRERYEAVQKIAAEMMASASDAPMETIAGLFSGQAGYATPKVDVRGVVFRDNRILLVREAQDGRWSLPGGWADPNESARECVLREIFEESGFTARAERLLAVYDRDKQGHVPPHPFHVYKILIQCGIVYGEARPSVETLDVAFFPETDLPELSLARVTASQIARCFELWRHPELAPDFD